MTEASEYHLYAISIAAFDTEHSVMHSMACAVTAISDAEALQKAEYIGAVTFPDFIVKAGIVEITPEKFPILRG